jgi:hypothetical protein
MSTYANGLTIGMPKRTPTVTPSTRLGPWSLRRDWQQLRPTAGDQTISGTDFNSVRLTFGAGGEAKSLIVSILERCRARDGAASSMFSGVRPGPPRTTSCRQSPNT